jgi:hypothetical protein
VCEDREALIFTKVISILDGLGQSHPDKITSRIFVAAAGRIFCILLGYVVRMNVLREHCASFFKLDQQI